MPWPSRTRLLESIHLQQHKGDFTVSRCRVLWEPQNKATQQTKEAAFCLGPDTQESRQNGNGLSVSTAY